MGRGNSIIYGKISFMSETETMDGLLKKLKELLKEQGYPEAKKSDDLTEKDEEDLKELEADLKKEEPEENGAEKSKPVFGRPVIRQ